MLVLATASLLLLATSAAAPAAAANDGAGPDDRCDRFRDARMAAVPGTVGARRLIDLPPGNLDLAVMRQIDGCPEPVTIREGYGAMAQPRRVKRAPRPEPPRTQLLR